MAGKGRGVPGLVQMPVGIRVELEVDLRLGILAAESVAGRRPRAESNPVLVVLKARGEDTRGGVVGALASVAGNLAAVAAGVACVERASTSTVLQAATPSWARRKKAVRESL